MAKILHTAVTGTGAKTECFVDAPTAQAAASPVQALQAQILPPATSADIQGA